MEKHFKRSYLVYSESHGSIFCALCYLFGGSTPFAKHGFSSWKKGNEKITMHENSKNHKSCVLSKKERGRILNRMDKQLTQQVETEISYWRNVLTRVVAVIKALSSRGLPFIRGRDDNFGSSQNGNFMMSWAHI